MLFGGFFNMPFQLIEDLVKRCYRGKIHLDAFANFRILKLFGHAGMVVFACESFRKSRQIILRPGVLDMGDKFTAPADQDTSAVLIDPW